MKLLMSNATSGVPSDTWLRIFGAGPKPIDISQDVSY